MYLFVIILNVINISCFNNPFQSNMTELSESLQSLRSGFPLKTQIESSCSISEGLPASKAFTIAGLHLRVRALINQLLTIVCVVPFNSASSASPSSSGYGFVQFSMSHCVMKPVKLFLLYTLLKIGRIPSDSDPSLSMLSTFSGTTSCLGLSSSWNFCAMAIRAFMCWM